MKKNRKVERMPDEQVIAFLEEVLLERGYMMPSEPEHITREDMDLYGKGVPLTMDELKQSFESLMQTPSLFEIVPTEISKSLAMAARNGDSISEKVWSRMRTDRHNAEAERKQHE